MNAIQKFLCLILLAAMLLSSAACAKKPGDITNVTNTTNPEYSEVMFFESHGRYSDWYDNGTLVPLPDQTLGAVRVVLSDNAVDGIVNTWHMISIGAPPEKFSMKLDGVLLAMPRVETFQDSGESMPTGKITFSSPLAFCHGETHLFEAMVDGTGLVPNRSVSLTFDKATFELWTNQGETVRFSGYVTRERQAEISNSFGNGGFSSWQRDALSGETYVIAGFRVSTYSKDVVIAPVEAQVTVAQDVIITSLKWTRYNEGQDDTVWTSPVTYTGYPNGRRTHIVVANFGDVAHGGVAGGNLLDRGEYYVTYRLMATVMKLEANTGADDGAFGGNLSQGSVQLNSTEVPSTQTQLENSGGVDYRVHPVLSYLDGEGVPTTATTTQETGTLAFVLDTGAEEIEVDLTCIQFVISVSAVDTSSTVLFDNMVGTTVTLKGAQNEVVGTARIEQDGTANFSPIVKKVRGQTSFTMTVVLNGQESGDQVVAQLSELTGTIEGSLTPIEESPAWALQAGLTIR